MEVSRKDFKKQFGTVKVTVMSRFLIYISKTASACNWSWINRICWEFHIGWDMAWKYVYKWKTSLTLQAGFLRVELQQNQILSVLNHNFSQYQDHCGCIISIENLWLTNSSSISMKNMVGHAWSTSWCKIKPICEFNPN
jgi:hypothetical protein